MISKSWCGLPTASTFHLISCSSSRFHPAQSASVNSFQLLKLNKDFLFLENLHILFFAPGRSVCLSAVNSQSLTSFSASDGSAFGCAHSLPNRDGSKDTSCHLHPVTESENGYFQNCHNISKLLPKRKTFSFLF